MPDAPQANPEDQKPAPKALKSTLNLPQTPFPMKANLPENEPKRLAAWQQQHLYAQIRAARAGAAKYILHDGPPYANGAIHLGHALNKCIKDFVVKTKTMAGFDAPYVPGWDCHGLPIEIKVDEQLGRKKLEMDPLAVRRACREYAAKIRRPPALPVRAHRRLRPLGQPLPHHVPRLRGPHRRNLLRLLREGLRLQRPPARLLVHPRQDRPRRSRSRVRAAHQPQRLRPLQTHQRPRGHRPTPRRHATSTPSSGPPPPGPSPPRRP